MPRKLTRDEILNKFKLAHSNVYDYSLVNYVNIYTKVKIGCEIHGIFEQTPHSHIHQKAGCQICAANTIGKSNRISQIEFIEKSRKVHNGFYDYSKTMYISSDKQVTIVCPKHGPFNQIASNHLHHSKGCKDCANEKLSDERVMPSDEFISRITLLYGNVNDYTDTVYLGNNKPITVRCKIHDIYFDQNAGNHLIGKSGCQKCKSLGTSRKEQAVAEFVESITSSKIIRNNRIICKPNELDIYIPDKNIAIEFCGVYWHTEKHGKDRNYHKDKHTKCLNQSIQLITIFEDEWELRQEQVKNKLENLLSDKSTKSIYARKTQIKVIDTYTKREFFNTNHIQGDGRSSINIGLFHNNELVAVMGFIKRSENAFELNRFASSIRVVGGFSKLLKYFQLNYEWDKIISFADLRWSDGNLYEQTGWTLDKKIPPDYSYVVRDKRIHKFNFRRKTLAKKLENYDSKLTEKENMLNHGLYRIWDCGKLRYEIKK